MYKKYILSLILIMFMSTLPLGNAVYANENTENYESSIDMLELEKNFEPTVEITELEERLVGEGNQYPIVLVHGLGGFGRGELGGVVNYWGGVYDIERDLQGKGYRAHTATVGPVSSNWDRAIELYYQIKGGTVDYGEAHSKEFGHNRYGKTFPGLYPEWGENFLDCILNGEKLTLTRVK